MIWVWFAACWCSLAVGFVIGRVTVSAKDRTTLPAPSEADSFAALGLHARLRLAEEQRDRYQRQAIDLQLATNGLLSEREELVKELRRRAN